MISILICRVLTNIKNLQAACPTTDNSVANEVTKSAEETNQNEPVTNIGETTSDVQEDELEKQNGVAGIGKTILPQLILMILSSRARLACGSMFSKILVRL